MSNRLLLRPLCLVSSLAIVLFIASERPGDARPNYKACWEKVYKDALKPLKGKVTCNVCHTGDDKKKLNHYGKAIAEELGEN